MNLELGATEIVLIIVMLAYIILISVVINRFQLMLNEIRKAKLQLKTNRISLEVFKQRVDRKMEAIRLLKRNSYFTLLLFGFTHLVIALLSNLNLLTVAIPFGLFLFILVGNYWLKGSSVASTLKTIPGVSDYHGL